jgi:hypothetical protein
MMPSARHTWMISSCEPGGPSSTLPSSTVAASPPVSDRAMRCICASNTDSTSARAARQVTAACASAVTSTASSSSTVRRTRSGGRFVHFQIILATSRRGICLTSY